MPGLCTICTSPNRDAIDVMLANGEAHTEVVKRYGVHRSAVGRHARMKHPRAESLATIGDEPTLPSHDWIKRQTKARGTLIEEQIVGRVPEPDEMFTGWSF